jgi:hypothetical protein
VPVAGGGAVARLNGLGAYVVGAFNDQDIGGLGTAGNSRCSALSVVRRSSREFTRSVYSVDVLPIRSIRATTPTMGDSSGKSPCSLMISWRDCFMMTVYALVQSRSFLGLVGQ